MVRRPHFYITRTESDCSFHNADSSTDSYLNKLIATFDDEGWCILMQADAEGFY